jgi:hypothetical protein
MFNLSSHAYTHTHYDLFKVIRSGFKDDICKSNAISRTFVSLLSQKMMWLLKSPLEIWDGSLLDFNSMVILKVILIALLKMYLG